MQGGLYLIINLVNSHFYIGSTNNLHRRWQEHKKELRNNYHDNPYLQNAWNKYGQNNFQFHPILFCKNDYLKLYEQLLLDKNVNSGQCYNICKDARSGMRDRHHTLETKRKIGLLSQGRRVSKETRQKMSNSRRGSKHYRTSLTENDITNIRLALQNGYTCKDLSIVYNVKIYVISDIKHRRTWRHL